jgi:hypothetical protein
VFAAAMEGEYALRVEYDIAAAHVGVRLGAAFARNPQAVIGRVLRPIFQSFLLPFHRLKPVHAAAVARDGRSILLVGAAGAGKTTTAIELAQNGFTLLSDDGPWLTMTGDGAVALSSLDYVHTTEDTLALFPALRRHVVGGRDHRDKYAIDRRAFAGSEEWRRPAPVRTYVELHRNATPRPVVTPLPRPQVLADVVRESMIVFRHATFRQPIFAQHTRWTLDCLSAMVAGAHAFRLTYRDDHLHELPAMIADLHG